MDFPYDLYQVSERLFNEVSFCVSGSVDPRIIKLLEGGGAKFRNYVGMGVTHFIAAPDALEVKVEEARDIFDLPIVKPSWVEYSCMLRKVLPVAGFSTDNNQLFSKVAVTASGLRGDDLKYLWANITYYGGTFNRHFVRSTTHLVVNSCEGRMYQAALRAGKMIVCSDWVTDSIKAGVLQDPKVYHPALVLTPAQVAARLQAMELKNTTLATTATPATPTPTTSTPVTPGAGSAPSTPATPTPKPQFHPVATPQEQLEIVRYIKSNPDLRDQWEKIDEEQRALVVQKLAQKHRDEQLRRQMLIRQQQQQLQAQQQQQQIQAQQQQQQQQQQQNLQQHQSQQSMAMAPAQPQTMNQIQQQQQMMTAKMGMGPGPPTPGTPGGGTGGFQSPPPGPMSAGASPGKQQQGQVVSIAMSSPQQRQQMGSPGQQMHSPVQSPMGLFQQPQQTVAPLQQPPQPQMMHPQQMTMGHGGQMPGQQMMQTQMGQQRGQMPPQMLQQQQRQMHPQMQQQRAMGQMGQQGPQTPMQIQMQQQRQQSPMGQMGQQMMGQQQQQVHGQQMMGPGQVQTGQRGISPIMAPMGQQQTQQQPMGPMGQQPMMQQQGHMPRSPVQPMQPMGQIPGQMMHSQQQQLQQGPPHHHMMQGKPQHFQQQQTSHPHGFPGQHQQQIQSPMGQFQQGQMSPGGGGSRPFPSSSQPQQMNQTMQPMHQQQSYQGGPPQPQGMHSNPPTSIHMQIYRQPQPPRGSPGHGHLQQQQVRYGGAVGVQQVQGAQQMPHGQHPQQVYQHQQHQHGPQSPMSPMSPFPPGGMQSQRGMAPQPHPPQQQQNYYGNIPQSPQMQQRVSPQTSMGQQYFHQGVGVGDQSLMQQQQKPPHIQMIGHPSHNQAQPHAQQSQHSPQAHPQQPPISQMQGHEGHLMQQAPAQQMQAQQHQQMYFQQSQTPQGAMSPAAVGQQQQQAPGGVPMQMPNQQLQQQHHSGGGIIRTQQILTPQLLQQRLGARQAMMHHQQGHPQGQMQGQMQGQGPQGTPLPYRMQQQMPMGVGVGNVNQHQQRQLLQQQQVQQGPHTAPSSPLHPQQVMGMRVGVPHSPGPGGVVPMSQAPGQQQQQWMSPGGLVSPGPGPQMVRGQPLQHQQMGMQSPRMLGPTGVSGVPGQSQGIGGPEDQQSGLQQQQHSMQMQQMQVQHQTQVRAGNIRGQSPLGAGGYPEPHGTPPGGIQVHSKAKTVLANMLNTRLQGTGGAEGVPHMQQTGFPGPGIPQGSPGVSPLQVPVGYSPQSAPGTPLTPTTPTTPTTPRSPRASLAAQRKNQTHAAKAAAAAQAQLAASVVGMGKGPPPRMPVGAAQALAAASRSHTHQFVGHDPSVKLPPDGFLIGCTFWTPLPNPCPEAPGWRQKILCHGGEVEDAYSPRVTHVLSDTQNFPEFGPALREGRRVVSFHWLSDICIRRVVSAPFYSLHLPVSFGAQSKPLQGETLSTTGFKADEKLRLTNMIKILGGKISSYFTRDNLALVALRPEGRKFVKAREWRKPVINVQFLNELMFSSAAGTAMLLQMIHSPKYQQFNTEQPFRFDIAPILHLMAAWKAPIRVSAECMERFRSRKRPVPIGDGEEGSKAKRLKLEEQEYLKRLSPPPKAAPVEVEASEKVPEISAEGTEDPMEISTPVKTSPPPPEEVAGEGEPAKDTPMEEATPAAEVVETKPSSTELETFAASANEEPPKEETTKSQDESSLTSIPPPAVSEPKQDSPTPAPTPIADSGEPSAATPEVAPPAVVVGPPLEESEATRETKTNVPSPSTSTLAPEEATENEEQAPTEAEPVSKTETNETPTEMGTTPSSAPSEPSTPTVAPLPFLPFITLPPPVPKGPCVMISGGCRTAKDKTRQKLEKLGARITEAAKEASILILLDSTYTKKFFCCLSHVEAIVTAEWVVACIEADKFVETETYIVHDPMFNALYGVELTDVLKQPRRNQLLEELRFYLSPNVQPSRASLREIVQNAGGHVLEINSIKEIVKNAKTSPKFFIVTCEQDAHLFKSILNNPCVIKWEKVLETVVSQKLEVINKPKN